MNTPVLFAALVQALEEMQAGLFTAQSALGRAQSAAEQLGMDLGLGQPEDAESPLEPIMRAARGSRDLGAVLQQRYGDEAAVTFADE